MTKLKCNINKCPFRVRDLQKEECPGCKYFRRYENRGANVYSMRRNNRPFTNANTF